MDTIEREQFQDTLTTTLQRKWDEFREERQAWEEKIAEERQKKLEDQAAAEKKKYDQLLELSTREAQERVDAAKFRNKLLAALVALVGAAGGTGGYFATQPKGESAETKETKDVKETVMRQGSALDSRVGDVESKVQALGTVAVEQQMQQSASTEFIVGKIDAAHPRTADKVDEPEEVEAARIKTEAIQKKKRRAKVLGEKYDPFDDLPKP